MPSPFHDLKEKSTGLKPFAVIGDTQRTMFGERLLFREQNDRERQWLLKALSAEDLAFVVHLGDMVGAGFKEKAWNYLDGIFENVSRRNIPVMPAMGNHDYWGNPLKGFKWAQERFPQFQKKRWYQRVYNDLCLLWIDSNDKVLGKRLWKEQLTWFEGRIREAENNSDVKNIMVFTHHPPFSNSLYVGDNHQVQWGLVPIVAGSRKAIGIFSGHAHGYERFFIQEKTFVVSGGGGGPRHRFRKGLRAPHRARNPHAADHQQPFHYILVTPRPTDTLFTVKGLYKNQSEIQVIEEFSRPKVF